MQEVADDGHAMLDIHHGEAVEGGPGRTGDLDAVQVDRVALPQLAEVLEYAGLAPTGALVNPGEVHRVERGVPDRHVPLSERAHVGQHHG
jgi:hypothetical protein